MTITFDAIWIPIALSVLWVGWAGVMLNELGSSGDTFFELCIGIAWPAIPVLSAWLIWALLT